MSPQQLNFYLYPLHLLQGGYMWNNKTETK